MKNRDSQERETQKPQTDSPSTSPDARDTASTPASGQAMASNVPQKTQSHFKALQRLQDLSQSERFQKELSEAMSDPDLVSQLGKLTDLGDTYGIDVLLYAARPEAREDLAVKPDSLEDDVDYCRTVDEVDEVYDYLESTRGTGEPSAQDLNRQRRFLLSLMSLPVRLCISPLATKRDVLRYVEKRWPEILHLQQKYHKKPVRIRKRPQRARDRFVAEHPDCSSQDLATMVRREFHGHEEAWDIDNIRQKLGKRMK